MNTSTTPWTLYHAKGTCAHAVQIALLEAGARFDTVWLNFEQLEQSQPAYLRINPRGRVPALATAQGY